MLLYVKGAATWHIQKEGARMYCGLKLKPKKTSYLTPLDVFMCHNCLRIARRSKIKTEEETDVRRDS
jgi:hypothetical protein